MDRGCAFINAEIVQQRPVAMNRLGAHAGAAGR